MCAVVLRVARPLSFEKKDGIYENCERRGDSAGF